VGDVGDTHFDLFGIAQNLVALILSLNSERHLDIEATLVKSSLSDLVRANWAAFSLLATVESS